jgi:adenylate kinase
VAHLHTYRIVFLGPPGCGKGTQAEELVKELGLPVIGAGRLLREVAGEDSERGRTVAANVNAGTMVPDEITVELIREHVAAAGEGGFILDGFPRHRQQAELLGDVGLTHVFDLLVPDELSRQRIAHRLSSDPEHARADDRSDEAIAQRFAIFQKNHGPLAEYYREKGILHDVDDKPTIAEVHQQIRGILGLPTERTHEVPV